MSRYALVFRVSHCRPQHPSLLQSSLWHRSTRFQRLPAASTACRDREQLQTPALQMQQSYSALERKAALYDKLARGNASDEEEKYEVDFFRKHYDEPPPSREEAAGPSGRGTEPLDTVGQALAGTGAPARRI